MEQQLPSKLGEPYLRLISSSASFIGLLEIWMIPWKGVYSSSIIKIAPAAASAQTDSAVMTLRSKAENGGLVDRFSTLENDRSSAGGSEPKDGPSNESTAAWAG
jgi:hypothetical protein